MDFLVAQTSVKRHENKNKKQINQQTIIKITEKLKNNRKVKATGNVTPAMKHYPRIG